MSGQPLPQPDLSSTAENEMRVLYRELLERWNRQDADGFASLFATDGNMVGFDGSPVDGREAIRTHLRQIFADHVTATYVAQVREVRRLAPGAAQLRAAAGMVPPGETELNPALNVIQALVALEQDGRWQIALFQNTPAQFHGRPDDVERLTAELQALL